MVFTLYRNFIISLFLLFNFIFTEHISFSDLDLDAEASGVIQLSVSNDNVLGGFQFQIIDFPNQGYFDNVVLTDRTSAFNVSFNEQADGSVIIVGFDLTGVGLSAGEGSILELTYVSTGIYTTSINLSLNETNTVLSDLMGVGLEFTYDQATIEILGQDPPPVIPPENLVATAGFGEVNLSWEDPNDTVVEILGYRIYRDGNFVGTSAVINYIDTGLAQVTEYCYTVTQTEGASAPSGQSEPACDALYVPSTCATAIPIVLDAINEIEGVNGRDEWFVHEATLTG